MAYNMFLKVGVGKEAVDGDSTDEKHEDWIEVVSYSHGVTVPTEAALGRPTGLRQHQDFTITKRVDKASVPLMAKLINNADIPEVKLELCRATGEKTTFMAYTLNDCRVSAIFPRASGKAEDPLPFEEVRFCYRVITWTYTTTSTDRKGRDEVYEVVDDIGAEPLGACPNNTIFLDNSKQMRYILSGAIEGLSEGARRWRKCIESISPISPFYYLLR